ncbi:MAG: glycosyltransferase [Pelistega sp.]|nr:glycosyltransferase [Pelistega sp.]
MKRKLRVLHIISGLGQGGAESVLTRLVAHSQEENIVLSFADEGMYGPQIRQAGVELHCLGMRPGRLSVGDFSRLIKKIRELKPDVVQTWMYHADFIAGLAARMAGCKHIAWGIRNSGYQLKQSSRSAYYLARLSGLMSRLIPQKIIVCGEQAAQLHQAWAYDKNRMIVIQNGYDLSRWQDDSLGAEQLRHAWQIKPGEQLLGFVARWNPLKDHTSLLRAYALLKQERLKQGRMAPRLVLVGKGLETSNAPLMALIDELGLKAQDETQLMQALATAQTLDAEHSDLQGDNKPLTSEHSDLQDDNKLVASQASTLQEGRSNHTDIILLGMRSDVPTIMSALDIHVLSSIAEGFPNVVAEAMACGTPCVVTDVGDAALMVGDLGWVAQPSNPEDLAQKIAQALNYLESLSMQEQEQYARRVRQFVLDNFSLSTMVDRYEQTWRDMVEA